MPLTDATSNNDKNRDEAIATIATHLARSKGPVFRSKSNQQVTNASFLSHRSKSNIVTSERLINFISLQHDILINVFCLRHNVPMVGCHSYNMRRHQKINEGKGTNAL